MRILTTDDDPAALGFLEQTLASEHEVIACLGGAAALARLDTDRFDLVITDLRMPAPDGLDVLRRAVCLTPPPPVVVLTGVDRAGAAVEALRLGACDFVVKPVDAAQLHEAVARAIALITPPVSVDSGGYGLRGTSAAMRLVRQLIPVLAARAESVLVVGETGTGKELCARALHEAGPRRDQPFVAHNMAATPSELAESLFFGHARGAFTGAHADHAGLFEQADRGTLFLDEVDSFPLPLQAKLLRVLEAGCVQRLGSTAQREVDVRLVAATSADLPRLVEEGAFRADLYYRVHQLEIVMPPLRERREDILPLADGFLREWDPAATTRPRLSSEACAVLMSHPWPGNVRELKYAIRSAAVLANGGVIRVDHLWTVANSAQRPAQSSTLTLGQIEREHIDKVMNSVGGNQSLAAKMLGIDRGTLARKLRALGR